MMNKTFAAKLFNAPYMLWAAIFIVVPLFIVVYFAFVDRDGAFTLDNIAQIPGYFGILRRSLVYSLIATAITFVISYPVALFLTRVNARAQATIIMLIMLPMWMNLLIRTYSWTTILERQGLINTLLYYLGLPRISMMNTAGAVVLGMVYNFLPYMILPIYTSLIKIDNSFLEAARDLGSANVDVFKRVILPLSMPGVVAGITMVFVPSISTFYIAAQLGGTGNLMIGDIIQRTFERDLFSGTGAALSLVLMVIVLISLAVMNFFAKSGEDEGGIVV